MLPASDTTLPGHPTRWRLSFLLAFVLSLALLLSPASVVLELKIWLASWLPYAAEIDRSDAFRHSDKWVHLGLFVALGLLGVRAWRQPGQRTLVWYGLIATAVATECLQHYIPGRSASLGDLSADLLGLALGGTTGLAGRQPLAPVRP